jgi:hypothetical protein
MMASWHVSCMLIIKKEKKEEKMNSRFNLPGFAWVAAVLFFLVVVMPQSTLAKKYGFYGSFHVGSTYPLSDLNERADSNIHFRYDLTFRYQVIKDKFEIAALVFYGFNQFTEDHFTGADNMYWKNLSLNIKAIASITPNYRLYLQAGPGSYTPKVGSNSSGYNFGGGIQVNMNAPSRIEFGVDYHVINATSIAGAELKTKFLTLQLGVIFPLF